MMNKKDLKMYEAPAFEEVELELQGVLCASGDPVFDDEGDSEMPGGRG